MRGLRLGKRKRGEKRREKDQLPGQEGWQDRPGSLQAPQPGTLDLLQKVSGSSLGPSEAHALGVVFCRHHVSLEGTGGAWVGKFGWMVWKLPNSPTSNKLVALT